MPRYEHLRLRWNSPSEYLDKNVPIHFRYCKKKRPTTLERPSLNPNFMWDSFKFSFAFIFALQYSKCKWKVSGGVH